MLEKHHIEQFADGSAAFASRLDAWHRLGIVTRACMTGAEVMVRHSWAAGMCASFR